MKRPSVKSLEILESFTDHHIYQHCHNNLRLWLRSDCRVSCLVWNIHNSYSTPYKHNWHHAYYQITFHKILEFSPTNVPQCQKDLCLLLVLPFPSTQGCFVTIQWQLFKFKLALWLYFVNTIELGVLETWLANRKIEIVGPLFSSLLLRSVLERVHRGNPKLGRCIKLPTHHTRTICIASLKLLTIDWSQFFVNSHPKF